MFFSHKYCKRSRQVKTQDTVKMVVNLGSAGSLPCSLSYTKVKYTVKLFLKDSTTFLMKTKFFWRSNKPFLNKKKLFSQQDNAFLSKTKFSLKRTMSYHTEQSIVLAGQCLNIQNKDSSQQDNAQLIYRKNISLNRTMPF